MEHSSIEELILDTRIDENSILCEEDIKELQNHVEKMVRMKNKSSKTMYKCHQNMIMSANKIKDEFNIVFLTAFLIPSS